MSGLRDRLVDFVAHLRNSGIRISVAETIDAMNAVASAGLERERMREALAAALIKDEAERGSFDAAFELFFASPRATPGHHPEHRGQQVSAGSGRGRPGENPSPQTDSPPKPSRERATGSRTHQEKSLSPNPESAKQSEARAQQQGGKDAREQNARAETLRDSHEAGVRGDARASGLDAARLERLRRIERMPFETFTDRDYSEAREALAPLVRRFRIRLGRRLRRASAGRIDFRRTIRAGMQRGGALLDLNFCSRRPRHVDLIILADISGSVRYAAQLMIELMAGARGLFRRVSSFVYVDHLAEADFEQGHLVMTPAPDLYARSDFGRVLGELWERRAGLLTRATVVVIMGDGRNNRLPARADVIREIARICRAVVWLNPEDPDRWGTGDSAIKQYAREVTALVPSRNLRDLQSALIRIA
jgi:uncharacterized protein